MALTQQQIDEAFAAMGLAPPSSALLGSLEGISNNYSALDTIIQLPQVQTSVLPIVAMFDLALGHAPVSSTLASMVESNLSQADLATAFVSSQAFANVYNGSVLMNPNTLITSANDSIITALFQNGLGHLPTQNTLNGFHGLTLAQAFLAFTQSQAVGVSATIDASLLSILELATGIPAQAETPAAPVSYTLTAGLDSNASLGAPATFDANATVTGQIDSGVFGDNAIWTFNPGDNLAFSGGTLSVVDLNHNPGTNELAGITITGPFAFNLQETVGAGIPASLSLFDFSLYNGVTQATSLDSSGIVTFANMPAGSVVAVSGSATTAPEVLYTYASANAAPTLTVDGGVNPSSTFLHGFAFINNNSSAAPTTATINSTGAANGSSKGPNEPTNPIIFGLTGNQDKASVTSLAVNAATNLIGELFPEDYNAGANLTVQGNAALVDLISETGPIGLNKGLTELPFGSVNASGLAGAVIMDADSSLKVFTGGAGGGNELLYGSGLVDFSVFGLKLSAAATSINGGGGTGNVLSAELVTGTNGSIFTDWQILDVTNLQNVTGQSLNAAIMANDAIAGLQFSAADNDTDHVTNIPANSTLAINGSDWTSDNGASGSTDSVQWDMGLTQTHLGGSGTTAVTFSNEDTTGTKSLYLGNLTSTGDTAVSIQSNGGGFDNGIATIFETNNHLTTVTLAGADYASLGLHLVSGDVADGVETDTTGTSTAGTTTASSLTMIDASQTTGGVFIAAGDTSPDGSGHAVTYTGLLINGGAGTDSIFNGAKAGTIMDGSGNHDFDGLGSSGGSITFGAGSGDVAYIGADPIAAGAGSHIANGQLVPTLPGGTGGGVAGSAIGDSVTFGAGSTGTVDLFTGAENGQVSITNLVSNAAWTSVNGATTGLALDFTHTGISSSLVDSYALKAADTNLATTVGDAISSAGAAQAIIVFTFNGDEFVIGHHAGGFTGADAIVELVGVSNEVIGATNGVAHLA